MGAHTFDMEHGVARPLAGKERIGRTVAPRLGDDGRARRAMTARRSRASAVLWVIALAGAGACRDDGARSTGTPGGWPGAAPPGMAGQSAGPVAAACERQLRDYLSALVADGPAEAPGGLELASVARAPSPRRDGLHVTVLTDADDPRPGRIAMAGAGTAGAGPVVEVAAGASVFGVGTEAEALARATEVGLATAAAAGTPVFFAIGAAVPWRFVVALASGATRAGLTRVGFRFEATGAGRARRPPPSSIDDDIPDPGGRLVRTFAERFDDPFPPLAVEIFARCPQAREALRTAFDADDRPAAIVRLLPPAVGACGCRVEIPAVERLYWEAWGREHGQLQTTVEVALSADGSPVSAPPGAPWREAHTALVMAASADTPIMLR